MRYGIASEMRAQGHVTFEAEDAETALVLLAAHDIDVLVTDIGLPGTSGDVFAAEARAVRPALRLVFATGLDHVRNPGVNEEGRGPVVLRKPYSWDELSAAIATAR